MTSLFDRYNFSDNFSVLGKFTEDGNYEEKEHQGGMRMRKGNESQ